MKNPCTREQVRTRPVGIGKALVKKGFLSGKGAPHAIRAILISELDTKTLFELRVQVIFPNCVVKNSFLSGKGAPFSQRVRFGEMGTFLKPFRVLLSPKVVKVFWRLKLEIPPLLTGYFTQESLWESFKRQFT